MYTYCGDNIVEFKKKNNKNHSNGIFNEFDWKQFKTFIEDFRKEQ